MAGSYKSFHDGSNVWTKVDLNTVNGSNYEKKFYAYYNNTLPSNLTNGLIHWYKLNNTANDSGSSPSNGTLSNGSYVDDLYHNANSMLLSNGSNTGLNCNYIPVKDTAMTIAFWMNSASNSSPTDPCLYFSNAGSSSNTGYAAYIQTSTNKIRILNSGAGTNPYVYLSNSTITLGQWYFVVHTFTGDTTSNGSKLYLNGILDNQATASGLMSGTASNNMVFANYSTSPTIEAFNGRLNNFMHWNRVLSQDEITQLYNLQRPSQIDGNSVFDFFDDFEGNALDIINKWTIVSGSPTLTNGILTMPSTVLLNSKTKNYTLGMSMNYKLAMATTTHNISQGGSNDGTWGGVNLIYHECYSVTNRDYLQTYLSGSGTITYGSFTASAGTYYTWEIQRNSSSLATLYRNGSSITTNSTNIPIVDLYTVLSTDTSTMYVDYVYDKKITSSTVTISYGAQESLGYYIEGKNFSNRKLVTVTVPTASGELTNFQISMPNSNFNSQGDVLIAEGYNYWNQDATTVWAKVGKIPANSSKTITVTPRLNVDDKIVNRGLVSRYLFANNSNDQMGNYNGSDANMSYTTDQYGRSTNAASFNGSNSSIDLAPSTQIPTGNKTISFWINAGSASTDQCIISNNTVNGGGTGPGVDIALWGTVVTRTLYFYINNGATAGQYLSTTYQLPAISIWYHITMVQDGTTLTVYSNGVQVATTSTTSGSEVAGDRRVMVGRNLQSNAYPFTGLLDSLRIYNVALTAQEVQKIYDSEKLQKGNMDGTFIFADDFEGTTLDITNKWTATGTPTPTVLNSVLTLSTTGSHGYYSKQMLSNIGSSIVTRKKQNYASWNQWYGSSVDGTISGATRVAEQNTYTAGGTEYIYANANSNSTTLAMSAGTFYVYDLQRNSVSLASEFRNGSSIQTINVTIPTDSEYIMFGQASSNVTSWDYIFLRKLNSSEPSVSISGSNPYTVTITNGTANDLIDYQVPLTSSSLGMTTQSYDVIVQDQTTAPSTTQNTLFYGSEF